LLSNLIFSHGKKYGLVADLVSLKASITQKGAVLLGKQVACDAFDESRPLRVVTHAHSDHLFGLQQSVQRCQALIMTPATRDLLGVMRNPSFLKLDNVKALDYGETLNLIDEQVTLHLADHILGAAQVLVEDHEGTRIVYTGDFRMPDTPVLEADILVLDATYGSSFQIRWFQPIVENALVSLVQSALDNGPVYIFSYNGKLQEIMQILHANQIDAPFIVPEKVFQISKVCECYGMQLGKVLSKNEDEAKEIAERNVPHVALYPMNSRRYVSKEAFRITVSGWEFSGPRRQIGPNEHVVALSDHSDFNGLLRYVEESKPKLVITDNYRAGDAEGLARAITKRLGIEAKAMPQ
jgi:putative mRNA 3-end processing factor